MTSLEPGADTPAMDTTETITRLNHPCDHCGVTELGEGLRAAAVRCAFHGGHTLELCESYFRINEEVLTERAIEIVFLNEALQSEREPATV